MTNVIIFIIRVRNVISGECGLTKRSATDGRTGARLILPVGDKNLKKSDISCHGNIIHITIHQNRKWFGVTKSVLILHALTFLPLGLRTYGVSVIAKNATVTPQHQKLVCT